MTKYVALIRAITPTDPRKTNDKLRSVLEGLGFSNVVSVISSGNLIFESDETDIGKLENMIEAAWPKILGFEAATIVRSQKQLQKILDASPFDGPQPRDGSYLLATFLKRPAKPDFDLPFQPSGKPYQIISYADGVLFTTSDNTAPKIGSLMTWLEKQFGKDITSRTPLTIERILKRMDAS